MPLHREIEAYMDQEKMYSLEGERGVSNFSKLVRVIGYDNLDEFLADNFGAVTALVEWIGGQDVEEWKEKLASQLHTPVDEGDE